MCTPVSCSTVATAAARPALLPAYAICFWVIPLFWVRTWPSLVASDTPYAWSILPTCCVPSVSAKSTQLSRGIEKPTAFLPPAGMWIRISVLVAFPPTPFSMPALLPACRCFRMLFGKMLPFQSVRLSRPISKMFCAPMDGPLVIAWEPPMLLTSFTK